MVKSPQSQLDHVFAALVDPTRRALLAHLAEASAVSVSDLARPLPVKLPGVMKHLDVLQEAGLIIRHKQGRKVTVQLTPQPMAEAMAWLRRYERFWSASLDRLSDFLGDASNE